MVTMADATRDHLLRVLDWEDAHIGFDKAVSGIPADKRGALAQGFEHSPWQLLEHIRLAQDDILDFCLNDSYQHTMKWPDDYWPKAPAPPSDDAWDKSLADYERSLVELKRVVREVDDLTATADREGQTDLPSFDPAHRGSHRLPRGTAGRGQKGAGRLVNVTFTRDRPGAAWARR